MASIDKNNSIKKKKHAKGNKDSGMDAAVAKTEKIRTWVR